MNELSKVESEIQQRRTSLLRIDAAMSAGTIAGALAGSMLSAMWSVNQTLVITNISWLWVGALGALGGMFIGLLTGLLVGTLIVRWRRAGGD